MGKFQDLSGIKFGKLTAIKVAYKNKNGESVWECVCDCGNVVNVVCSNLKNGHSTSCGCYKKICSITHNETKTRLHRIWAGIKARCYNTTIPQYKNWGGRGITVCDEWKDSYETFRDWALNNGYQENLTIDRIDNDKGYNPNNCRWATPKQQSNNKRNNTLITFNNETHTISEWAEIIGVKSRTIQRRLVKNMPIEKILYIGDMRNGNRN
jgi:hypothetical protein